MFPTTRTTTAPLSGPARVGDRHTVPARSHLLVVSKGSWASGDNVCHFGSSPAGRLGPNHYHPSPKVTNILLDQISTPLLRNIWSVASYQFVLKPLTNSYNQDPAPCRQHCSTPLTIKILLVFLTGPHNPLLCHYFCYFLEWVYDNEMFTAGDTLSCPYERLGEEISCLHSLRAIRG